MTRQLDSKRFESYGLDDDDPSIGIVLSPHRSSIVLGLGSWRVVVSA